MRRPEGISVIVCCYNSVERITPTFQHLFRQNVTQGFDWEIILVDNNSSDNTSQKSEELYIQSDSSIPFKVVSEPNPGLSNARQAGFDSSKYEIVLMVDDDNWLSSNYLDGIWNAFQKDDAIGMVGGLGNPELSRPAPEWFERYAYCYATGPQTEDGEAGITEHLYGAGLALKLSVLDRLKANGFTSLLSDRIGNSLMSGGDTELCFAFRMAGAKLYYEPSITFQHELPQERIDWAYLRRLFHGFGLTKATLDMYTACINEYDIPIDGKLPFWFNRMVYLAIKLLPDLPLLIHSKVARLDGNRKLLFTLGKVGQLQAILMMRKDFITKYEAVYRLSESLK